MSSVPHLTERVAIRLSAEALRMLQSEAVEHKMSFSDYLRHKLGAEPSVNR